MRVAMLAFPDMTQLDFTGPHEVFSRFKELAIDIVWKKPGVIDVGGGLQFLTSTTYDNCPQADILFVPGGAGQFALMDDQETLTFLRRQAEKAQYITSVCTGSLVLAASGLLTGYRATCHWASLNQLAYFDAEPVAERVVIDRNRITGAGVTSGIDFALTLVGQIFGEERAKRTQLFMEYDPEPPFPGGSPKSSDPALVAEARNMMAGFQVKREEAARKAANLLKRP